MFDRIKFFEYTGQLLTLQNLKDNIPKQNIDTSKQEIMHREAELFCSKSSFSMDGQIRILFPFPTTPFAEKNYFIPQGLFVCHQSSHYYTKRSDYRSYMILYTIDGEGTLEYEGQTYTLKKGDGFFIDCRNPQNYYTHGEFWDHIDLHFIGAYSDDLYEEYQKNGEPIFHEPMNGALINHLERLATLWDSVSVYKALQISNLISELVTYLLVLKNQPSVELSTTMHYLLTYIEHNYATDLTLDFLAEFTSLSKFHLSRKFKQFTGFSPIQYIINIRIERAKFLLVNTDLALYEIAEAIGFRDMNNFTNQFKKVTGVTPTAYRKQGL